MRFAGGTAEDAVPDRYNSIGWTVRGNERYYHQHEAKNPSANDSEAEQHPRTVHVIGDEHEYDQSDDRNTSRYFDLLTFAETSCPGYGSTRRQENSNEKNYEKQPSLSVMTLVQKSLKNFNAKSESSRKPHDTATTTQKIPSPVTSFGRGLTIA